MSKKIYHLRCAESGLTSLNATYIYELYIVASSERVAIRSVLKNETLSVEVLSVHDFVDVD